MEKELKRQLKECITFSVVGGMLATAVIGTVNYIQGNFPIKEQLKRELRIDKQSADKLISLSENDRIIAQTARKILDPVLYEQPFRSSLRNALYDIRYGYFRDAKQFLRNAAGNAEWSGNTFAVNKIDLTYSYVQAAEIKPMPGKIVVVDRKSAERLSTAFIGNSQTGQTVKNGTEQNSSNTTEHGHTTLSGFIDNDLLPTLKGGVSETSDYMAGFI